MNTNRVSAMRGAPGMSVGATAPVTGGRRAPRVIPRLGRWLSYRSGVRAINSRMCWAISSPFSSCR